MLDEIRHIVPSLNLRSVPTQGQQFFVGMVSNICSWVTLFRAGWR